jgi:predicted metal-dependent hydrolase
MEKLSEKYFYKGTPLPLKISYSDKIGNVSIAVSDTALEILVHPYFKNKIDSALLRTYMVDWLKKQAHHTFPIKMGKWSEITGLFPYKVRIKDQRTRWGSCSSKNNINLNWRLIMAPEDVLDYVIVHELCHLAVPNHSKSFWALVAKYLPTFPKSKNWLKNYGQILLLT